MLKLARAKAPVFKTVPCDGQHARCALPARRMLAVPCCPRTRVHCCGCGTEASSDAVCGLWVADAPRPWVAMCAECMTIFDAARQRA